MLPRHCTSRGTTGIKRVGWGDWLAYQFLNLKPQKSYPSRRWEVNVVASFFIISRDFIIETKHFWTHILNIIVELHADMYGTKFHVVITLYVTKEKKTCGNVSSYDKYIPILPRNERENRSFAIWSSTWRSWAKLYLNGISAHSSPRDANLRYRDFKLHIERKTVLWHVFERSHSL